MSKNMKCLVTGGAGFIASNLVDRLLADGHAVTAYDNFSTGFREFLRPASANPRFTLVEGDTQDLEKMASAMAGCDTVFHLAANADVRFGPEKPRRDLEQNTIATFNVLEAMRKAGVKRIAFSSTSAIYGVAEVIPTPENAPFPVQTSLYGASKLAGEGMIQAYSEAYGIQSYIFRFVSILGDRYHHGHVYDFYKKLKANPLKLDVLGDGTQRKSYLYVQDCVDAIFTVMQKAQNKVNIFNLGTKEFCDVNQSLGWICGHLNVKPEFNYAGGKSGWIGDNPFIFPDCSKVYALGWRPKLTIKEGIIKTLEYIQANEWVLTANPDRARAPQKA